MRKTGWLSAATAAIAVAALVGGARAQELRKIVIAQQHPLVSIGEEVFFFAVPKRLGYFRDENLDVELQSVANASAAIQALQSGSAQLATTQAEAVLKVREQGGDAVAFFALRHGNGSKIALLPDSPVRELADFRGKTLGGLSWAAGGGPVLMRMLSDVGLSPQDYQRVTVGAGPGAATALMNKQIDGLVLWDSIFAAFENKGLKFRYIEMPLQRSMGALSMATTQSFMKAQPKAVEGFCRAVAKGMHFARTNPAAAIDLFLQEFPALKTPGAAPATLIAHDVHILKTWMDAAFWDEPVGSTYGAFPAGVWRNTQAFFVKSGGLKGSSNPDDGYTNALIGACNDFDKAAVARAAERYELTIK
jgi:NitT/TauT family transport system substrate-binding protein